MRPPAAPRRPAPAPGPAASAPASDPPGAAPQEGGPSRSGSDLVMTTQEMQAFEAGERERTGGVERPVRTPERGPIRDVEATQEPAAIGRPVSALEDRRKERQRARRRVLWSRLSIGAGILVVVGVLIWLVAFSPVLALRADAVSVEGQSPSSTSPQWPTMHAPMRARP